MEATGLSGKAVGQPVQRVDGIAKVTGRARYAGDIELPGMLFGRCLRSPHASARIVAFGLMILAAAMQAIGRNRMRSALTMLGVFIGVAALIVMVAVGQGANEAVPIASWLFVPC